MQTAGKLVGTSAVGNAQQGISVALSADGIRSQCPRHWVTH
jgi:hypothetical protein